MVYQAFKKWTVGRVPSVVGYVLATVLVFPVSPCAIKLAGAQNRPVQNSPAQDSPLQSTVTAPQGTVRISDGLGGAYYAEQELVKRYEQLKLRLQTLKSDLTAGRGSSKSALQEIASIEGQAKELRDAIDATKTFVAAFRAFKRTEVVMIDLADSKTIIMHGDRVRMRGWDGDRIKVVLEKIILAKEKPPVSEFDAISVEHQVEVAEDLVGRTAQQREDDNQKFRQSEQGQKMTEEQLQNREAFAKRLFSSYDRFADYQGVQANRLSIKGLQHQQGNRQVSYKIQSPAGGATHTSAWKRQASVTVYVPKCKRVLIAGCMEGLDVADISADLMLTQSGSHNRDYSGTFEIRGVDGNVVIDQAPIGILSDVSGNVACTLTNEFVNSGTRHDSNGRTTEMYEMAKTEFSKIKGDLQAHFLRTDLRCSEISGTINIENEFGPTRLDFNEEEETERSVRVVSQSGNISINGINKSIPVYAYTQCGILHTNLSQSVLENLNISTGSPTRNWHGLIPTSQGDFSLERFERPAKIVVDAEREPGVDLISHAGRVEVLGR